MIMLLVYTPEIKVGHPCCYILICCRSANKGMTFLVNGKWNEAHDYKDINQVSDIMQRIKDAGIKTIIVDMSNDAQWTNYWDEFKQMLENIQKICRDKNMQYLILIGAAEFSFGMRKLNVFGKCGFRIQYTGSMDSTVKVAVRTQSTDDCCVSACRYVLGTL